MTEKNAAVRLGSPAPRILLLGGGELGREFAIEAVRLGAHLTVADRYAHAPAMTVAHKAEVTPIGDAQALRALVDRARPDIIVPEIEAIAVDALAAFEQQGAHVVPNAAAVRATMDREAIRRIAAEELGLPTSPYAFAGDGDSFHAAVGRIGTPCLVKPVMSSSGKGQSLVRDPSQADDAWRKAIEGSRGQSARVIVEGFVAFDFEITLLTVRHARGTSFCAPIGHTQQDGDYRTSWQPQPMSAAALAEAERQARSVTERLGGFGLFGAEFFVRGGEVIFSEISPRPHDTGLVTLSTQAASEFALHARAVLGFALPPRIECLTPGASGVLLAPEASDAPAFAIDPDLFLDPDLTLQIFAKPSAHPGRRLGVVVARGASIEDALSAVRRAQERVAFAPSSD